MLYNHQLYDLVGNTSKSNLYTLLCHKFHPTSLYVCVCVYSMSSQCPSEIMRKSYKHEGKM